MNTSIHIECLAQLTLVPPSVVIFLLLKGLLKRKWAVSTLSFQLCNNRTLQCPDHKVQWIIFLLGNEDPVFHGKGGDFGILKLEKNYMPFESSSRVLVEKFFL